MKALFVAHSGETGCGANRSLLTLMAALRQRYGVEPSVLVPGEGTPLSRRCAEVNIPVYARACRKFI
ncbi:MAG: hypothetical protein IKH57_16700 [Clostridia bacterium]|nr:hypothetical protein [Clostridia bacterium]